ncbi:hypothetical protein DMUE_1748 [Dictyocoela muelleri]|nr:hypothetical protein DMUE_1748 [Dictyocoela muelleri]
MKIITHLTIIPIILIQMKSKICIKATKSKIYDTDTNNNGRMLQLICKDRQYITLNDEICNKYTYLSDLISEKNGKVVVIEEKEFIKSQIEEFINVTQKLKIAYSTALDFAIL